MWGLAKIFIITNFSTHGDKWIDCSVGGESMLTGEEHLSGSETFVSDLFFRNKYGELTERVRWMVQVWKRRQTVAPSSVVPLRDHWMVLVYTSLLVFYNLLNIRN